jgi:hypothetical protein
MAGKHAKAAEQYNIIGGHESALGAFLYGKQYDRLAKYLHKFVAFPERPPMMMH